MSPDRLIPRILVAGTHSGCGKTTVASGLMAALTASGLRVQPFKVGPDFIDPTHHTKICGRVSRNLDPFMMGETGVRETFCHACRGADIAVIEGVMGLYDGIDGTENASTAHVASLLRAPVILVVDARGMSRSAHALIQGYRSFSPEVRIAGVIFNRVGSSRHRQMIERDLGVKAVGWIPRSDVIAVPSRHLGLAMAHENTSMARTGDLVREHCDLDSIRQIASGAPPLPQPHVDETGSDRPARIGVAFDPAFCFYYEDNLDRLRSCGAEVVLFSPLEGGIPDIDGIYFGGGYPELYPGQLAASPCTRNVQKAAESGMPIYGECGGLMYLTRGIGSDRSYAFCGVLPANSHMTEKIQALGYVRGEFASGDSFLPQGLPILGHEFHYSKVDADRDARFTIALQRGKGIANGRDGIAENRVTGSYTHAYFSTEFCRCFIRACADYRSDAGRP